MVVGILRVEKTTEVKNNPFYGNYKIKDTFTHHIVNERYTELVSPEKGIHIVVGSIDGDNLDISINKYAFTGEPEEEYNVYTEFSTSFGFGGHIYEVSVNIHGELTSLDEWYSLGDFEDGKEPDNHYKKNSRSIKWETMD